MRAQKNGIYLSENVNAFTECVWRNADDLEDLFDDMSLDEITKSKPKSRLESFLRKKALEKKKHFAFRKK